MTNLCSSQLYLHFCFNYTSAGLDKNLATIQGLLVIAAVIVNTSDWADAVIVEHFIAAVSCVDRPLSTGRALTVASEADHCDE